MMPSQWKVAATHAIEIDLANESGLRLKKSYELLSKQVGGYDNLGFTKQDHKNYLRTKRQRDMEHGETTSLGRYFSRQLKENPSYYFATQLDYEEVITNIFWADARMIIDYSRFGDVITFDTTYSTNRDARPLGVFLGLNHHRETVVYGGALLYDETIESFVWLFETFLEAMSEKKLITIFTDQDAAMLAAIKVVITKTYHALCSWHMWQNAEKHLAWNEMLDKYNVRENKWLIDLFNLKEKWAQAYFKRNFTAGMKTTQLSESFNADLKDCLHTDLNIVEFFTHFERVVNQKQDKELEAEYNFRHKFPRLKLKSSPMLNQVATVYTSTLFDLFQIEVEEVMTLSILEHNVSQTHSYVVGVFNKYGKYEVMWNPLDETLSCSCKKFESFGILCRHGLKVLGVLDIKLIPNRYIMKGWRRDAKDGSGKNCTTHNIKPDIRLEYVDWYRDLCSKYIQLVNEEIYAHDIMAQKKTEDISSGNITSFTQLLMGNGEDLDPSLGAYQVKKAYDLIVRDSGVSALPLWHLIWKVQVPSKFCNLVWRLLHDSLPTFSTLRSRGIPMSITCPLCDEAKEKTSHLFLFCSFSRATWHGTSLVVHTFDLGNSSIQQWIERLLQIHKGLELDNMSYLQGIFTTLWSIWTHGNLVVHEGKHPNPLEVVLTTQSLSCRFKEAFSSCSAATCRPLD
ncbi:protein FAR1-RELATED SEQUENCE 5-like [Castanea sativa]|uniref:protein FAR1-RELATED SEQUENCE 5-like n=1 Tax=Castanea sativa TaxID=21020 RepID=UPI003F653963